jgi:hypothetical protein
MTRTRIAAVLVAGACTALAAGTQAPLDQAAVALRSHEAMVALDRYLETWNSRDAATWATSLHFPHVRPGAGVFEMSATAQAYAAGVNFEQTLKTGWHHSEWVSREVLQVAGDKIHAAGEWRRYTADGRAMTGSVITYILTKQENRWGVQARFAAGASGIDAEAGARNAEAGRHAVSAFMQAWNSHDPAALAAALHYPHVRIADGRVEIWRSAEEFLAGPEPGRQRTWHETKLDEVKVVQTTLTGVNLTVRFSRLGRDGGILSKDEGVFLVALRGGVWKLQARSTMGS